MKTIYTCFPGGKHKVLTMSYDDGREEDYRLVEMFNKYGIKGTFNLNAGIDWDPREFRFPNTVKYMRGMKWPATPIHILRLSAVRWSRWPHRCWRTANRWNH